MCRQKSTKSTTILYNVHCTLTHIQAIYFERPVSVYLCFQEQKTDLIYSILYRTHFTKCLVQKNKFFSEVKLRIIFEKKKYFWQSSTTDKDISKIPTDSSSAGQQLNGSQTI